MHHIGRDLRKYTKRHSSRLAVQVGVSLHASAYAERGLLWLPEGFSVLFLKEISLPQQRKAAFLPECLASFFLSFRPSSSQLYVRRLLLLPSLVLSSSSFLLFFLPFLLSGQFFVLCFFFFACACAEAVQQQLERWAKSGIDGKYKDIRTLLSTVHEVSERQMPLLPRALLLRWQLSHGEEEERRRGDCSECEGVLVGGLAPSSSGAEVSVLFSPCTRQLER